jgi:segregation and condensation protein B
MDRDGLVALIEAILLTAKSPVRPEAVAEAVGEPDVGGELVERLLIEMRDAWERPDRGVRIEEAAGGWRVVTPPELDASLRRFHGLAARQRLSQAALEVLAIVAHRQPVTLPEINFIRGATSAGVVRTLLDRRLVRIAGRKAVVGKPYLYRTTREFLEHFGLQRVDDLPDPEELVASDAVSDAHEA